MARRIITAGAVALLVLLVPVTAAGASTLVPGHQSAKYDTDGNGIADAGMVVTGKYSFDMEWEDGVCTYQVQYRGSFENTPFLDDGWIMNAIVCKDADGTNAYQYLIVHETDPRYTGNPDLAIWGNWEYHTLVESGTGNVANLHRP